MIYKYCNSLGIDILANSRLKISRLSTINDPFDWSVSSKPAPISYVKRQIWESPELIPRWERIFSQYHVDIRFSDPERFIEKILEFQVRDMQRVIANQAKNIERKFGFISFSKMPDIIPMWAHYGGNHGGLTFGIDESELKIDPKEIIEIQYNDEMPVFKVSANTIDEAESLKTIRESYSRKANSWSYESEKRILAQLNNIYPDGNFYVAISKIAIKEIYLGLRFDVTNEMHQAIWKFQSEGGKIFKMTKSSSEYKLIPILEHISEPDTIFTA